MHDEFGFRNFQNIVQSYAVDLVAPEFDNISEELMNLLEDMLKEDQFFRSSLIDSNHHTVFLSKTYAEDEVNIINPEQVVDKLKVFQGEMEMHSHMWGMLQARVMWAQKWKRRTSKNLDKVKEAQGVSKGKLGDGFKFFTTDPKLLEFHAKQLHEKLGNEKEFFDTSDIIAALKQLDIDFHK